MNAENFINNFGHLVNAPGGPMRVREMILQLAFSGDLTLRSLGDTLASVSSRGASKLEEKQQKEQPEIAFDPTVLRDRWPQIPPNTRRSNRRWKVNACANEKEERGRV